jgi:hypothetical protein
MSRLPRQRSPEVICRLARMGVTGTSDSPRMPDLYLAKGTLGPTFETPAPEVFLFGINSAVRVSVYDQCRF